MLLIRRHCILRAALRRIFKLDVAARPRRRALRLGSRLSNDLDQLHASVVEGYR